MADAVENAAPATASAAPEAAEAPSFRRPAARARANVRKRVLPTESREDPEDASRPSVTPAAPGKKPASGASALSATTRRTRPSGATVAAVHNSDKRITAHDNKVFAVNEQETEHDRDARAIFERAKSLEADEAATGGEKLYRGANNYRAFTDRPESFDKAVRSGLGPQRASLHHRAISRFDYQPDICKDYKETGYCGYGDACVFLHDRGDYKSGWQIEKEWQAEEKEREMRRARILAGELEEEEGGGEGGAPDDDLPFACLLCRKPWTQSSAPVVTRCGHHFCEACALGHFKKSKRCATCNEPTHGTFNAARRLRERIKAAAAGGGAAAAAAEGGRDGGRDGAESGDAPGARRSTVSTWNY